MGQETQTKGEEEIVFCFHDTWIFGIGDGLPAASARGAVVGIYPGAAGASPVIVARNLATVAIGGDHARWYPVALFDQSPLKGATVRPLQADTLTGSKTLIVVADVVATGVSTVSPVVAVAAVAVGDDRARVSSGGAGLAIASATGSVVSSIPSLGMGKCHGH
jgi:hypothetical protein